MSGDSFVKSGDDNDGNLSPSLPLAYSKKRRGWDGDHLEFTREQPTEDLASHAAVNLGQFRNEQIGVGYQAKHVIRQRSVPDTSVTINDMTPDTTANIVSETKGKRTKLRKADAESNPMTTTSRLQKYLKCKGMSQFRKELASIEAST